MSPRLAAALLLAASLPTAVSASPDLGGVDLGAMKKSAAGSPGVAGAPAGLEIVMDCASVKLPKKPDTSKDVAGPDASRGNRAGFADAKFTKNLAVYWKEPAPAGEKAEPFFVTKIEALFKIAKIDLYVSATYPEPYSDSAPQPYEKECPFHFVFAHEQSHAQAYRDIAKDFCGRLEKDLWALAKEGKIPSPESPWPVKGSEVAAKKEEIAAVLVEAVKKRRQEARDCMDKDKANKDSKESYCRLYKRCDPWTWGTALDDCKDVKRDSPEPTLPAECLPALAPAASPS